MISKWNSKIFTLFLVSYARENRSTLPVKQVFRPASVSWLLHCKPDNERHRCAASSLAWYRNCPARCQIGLAACDTPTPTGSRCAQWHCRSLISTMYLISRTHDLSNRMLFKGVLHVCCSHYSIESANCTCACTNPESLLRGILCAVDYPKEDRKAGTKFDLAPQKALSQDYKGIKLSVLSLMPWRRAQGDDAGEHSVSSVELEGYHVSVNPLNILSELLQQRLFCHLLTLDLLQHIIVLLFKCILSSAQIQGSLRHLRWD